MKGKGRRFLCSFVALIMVMASAGTAFAAGNTMESTAVDNTAESIAAGSLESAAADVLLTDPKAQGTIGVTLMETGDETPVASFITYNGTDNILEGRSSYMGYSERVWLEKGTVIMAAKAENSEGTGSASYGVFMNQAMNEPVDSYGYATESNGTDTGIFEIPASGYYWVGAYSYTYDPAETCDVTLSVINISGADREVYSGQMIAVGQKTGGQINYFKFKAKNTGYLVAQGSEDNSFYMTLLNGSKKALSEKSSYSGNQDVWAVKKGKTYYIKVEALYSSYDAGGYFFKIKNTKVAEKSGASKAKAVTIKKGKTVKGTIIAGESKADWYKFKLTKGKKVKLTMKGATNDELKIMVYKGSRKVTNTGTLYPMYTDGKYSCPTITMTLDKGTYQIKVYRGNNKSSGYYTLKWK